MMKSAFYRLITSQLPRIEFSKPFESEFSPTGLTSAHFPLNAKILTVFLTFAQNLQTNFRIYSYYKKHSLANVRCSVEYRGMTWSFVAQLYRE